ncbi:hypothetical protein GGP93_003149 [Salinibacter ruber]|nr:hypothetical protein [Salinibacter ruber]
MIIRRYIVSPKRTDVVPVLHYYIQRAAFYAF